MAGAIPEKLLDEAVVSYEAGAALTSSQFSLVKNHSTDYQCVVTAAATDVPLGRLNNSPASGEEASVQLLVPGQILRLVADGSVTADAWVTPAASGKVTDTLSANGEFRIGVALKADSADGDLVPVLIYPTFFTLNT